MALPIWSLRRFPTLGFPLFGVYFICARVIPRIRFEIVNIIDQSAMPAYLVRSSQTFEEVVLVTAL